jgi:hypothetical protein
MTETPKKTKTAAKPKKTDGAIDAAGAKTETKKAPAKKTPAKAGKIEMVAKPEATREPAREEIAELAHRFWAERGHHHGHHVDDWFRAEQELRGKAS